MAMNVLDKLAALIAEESEALLAQWRHQVRELPSARHLDTPTLNDHIPVLLKELSVALRCKTDESIPEALSIGSSPIHGKQRADDNYDIVEVVAEYNILRGCIHDLADSNGLILQGQPFHTINRVLDGAIAYSVQTFSAQRALEVQQRREEYLAFVAHDLRTPLNAISLAARVLEFKISDLDVGSDTNQMLQILHRNAQYLDVLVGKVLEENANLQTESGLKLERRTLDLWPLVEVLIRDLRPVSGAGGSGLINRVPDGLMVHADASLLRRILQNLIGNAIKYTPQGEIVIGACEMDGDAGVECWVSDNGAGIPADLVEHVFDKWESDPESDEGNGLGLAIVKTFVEAHGGIITVESLLGSGATFRFTLPRQATAKG